MSYDPVVIERFGGLDLKTDPPELGLDGAISVLNVAFDRSGRVRTRDGTTAFSTTAHATTLTNVFALSSKLVVLRFDGANIAADFVSSSGVVTSAVTTWGGTAIPTTMARFGTPTAEIAFFAATGATTLRKYTVTTNTWSNSTGKPQLVAVTPWDNRLVQANFAAAADSPSGANGSPSTIFFSDPGAPETFTANNYLHLRPGDGEVITAMVAWGNRLFVFKESAIFVVNSTNVDGSGNPIFNYETVQFPPPVYGSTFAGAIPPAAAGPDGVYFATGNGIWRTQGGPAEKISGPVDPIFDGTADSTMARSNAADTGLYWAGNLLFATYTITGSVRRFLVWDRSVNQWSIWTDPGSTGLGGIMTYAPLGQAQSTLYIAAGTRVLKYGPSYTSDNGAAIASHYQSGFSDLGSASQSTVRQSQVWGLGNVTYKMAVDFGAADTGADLTLGSTTIDDAIDRVARRGYVHAVRVSAIAGAWAVNRIVLFKRNSRLPGTKAT